jgi:hypothetical protein
MILCTEPGEDPVHSWINLSVLQILSIFMSIYMHVYLRYCITLTNEPPRFRTSIFSSFFFSKGQKVSSRASLPGGLMVWAPTGDVQVDALHRGARQQKAKLQNLEANFLLLGYFP